MNRFEEYLRATREELASFVAAVTTGARESVHAGPDQPASAWIRSVDRADLTLSQESLARIGPGGFSAALHSLLCAELDRQSQRGPALAQIEAGSAGGSSSAKLTFTLKDDTEVEEDIECARLVLAVESASETSLRELRTLCAALREWPEVRPEGPALHPQASARILLETVRDLPLSGSARRVLLRLTAPALASALGALYAKQIAQLNAWGIKPARYTIRQGTDARQPAGGQALLRSVGADLGGPVLPAGSPVSAVLQELLAQAGMGGSLAGRPTGSASAAPETQALAGTMDPRLMGTLVRRLPDQLGVGSRLREVFEQLEDPGVRLAEQTPAIWQDTGHPWWGLLGRLVSLCETYESQTDGLQDALAMLVAPLLSDLGVGAQRGALGDGSACLDAIQAVDAAVREFTGGEEAESTQEDPDDEESADGDSTEPGDPLLALSQAIRDQMSRQIRSTTAPLTVRRFLQGPWVRVLATAMEPETGDRRRAERYTEMVDQILAVADPSQPAALSLDEAQAVLHAAREGCAYAGIPDALAESHLAGLSEFLCAEAAPTATPVDPAQDRQQHAALPTVPVELHGSTVSARARRDRMAWLSSLRAGDRLRLFLDGEWMTLQLMLCDEAGDMYQFKGRDARPGYCLTRSALERLRGEGLATTLDLVS